MPYNLFGKIVGKLSSKDMWYNLGGMFMTHRVVIYASENVQKVY